MCNVYEYSFDHESEADVIFLEGKLGKRQTVISSALRAFLFGMIGTMSANAAQAQGPAYVFDILAGEADKVLLKIAALTDTPILLSPKEIKAVRAKEVRGTFSLKEALEIALHCTGLRAHINDHAVITVVTDNPSKCGLHQEGVAMSQKNIGRAVGKLAAVVAVSGNLEAQPNTTQDTDDNVLEEVVVTAQKRAQSLRDVPVSVTAISVNDINAFLDGGVSIKALAARAPSLNVNGNSGRFLPQFYIRGPRECRL